MSVVFAGNNSGTFVSNGTPYFLVLPSGFDAVMTYNRTQEYTAGGGQLVYFRFWNGMTQGLGTQYTKTSSTNALAVSQVAAGAGAFFQDTSVNNPGASVVISSIDGSTPPVVATGNTAGLIANSSIVRIFNVAGAQQLGGIDFTVGTIVPSTSFTLAYMQGIAAASPGAGSYRIIPYNPYFYPSIRTISKIEVGNTPGTAIVTLTVTQPWVIGQEVRFIVPEVTALAFGMTQLNDVQATIVNVGEADTDGTTNTVTVNVDVSSFGSFVWPLTTDPGFTPPQLVPFGEQTSQALSSGTDILADSEMNIAQRGLLLMAGANSPAGVNADIIDWIAYKSFNGV